MRPGWILAMVIATSTGLASAEKVKTNQSAKVYNRPGEHGKVIVSVKSGQNMTLLAQDGRWLKVRVQGRTGYVPRSKVDMADGDEIVRNTRRRAFVDGRGTKRGFTGDAPEDRVGGDATETSSGDDDSSGDADSDKDKDSDKEKPSKPAKTTKPAKASKVTKASKASKGDGGDDDSESGGDDEGDKTGKGDKTDKADKGDSGDSSEDEPKVSEDETSAAEPSRPTAHVSGKTVIYSERDKSSEQAFVARPSTTLYVNETKGKWTYVETDEGDSGWVQSSLISVEGGEDGGDGGASRKRVIVARARMGVSFLSQGMRTAGAPAAFPDSYNDSTSAATVSIGAGYLYPYGKSLLLGGELDYDFAKAIPGIFYKDMATGMSQDIGVTVHNVNVRGLVGYDLHKKSGITVFGRLGYRYYGFIVDGNAPYDPKQNMAKLPSETTTGITVGGALDIPRLSEKIGLSFAVDAMMLGVGVSQTKALEDGSKPTASIYCVGAMFTYHWKSDMELQGTYELNYGSYDFGPPLASSMRNHMGTDVTRTDILHMVTFGIAKGF